MSVLLDHVTEALEGLHVFFQVVLPARMYLPPADVARAQDGMQRYLVHYQHLCYTNMVANMMLFMMAEKESHHDPWHIAWMTRDYDPRCGWTYADEDFVGKNRYTCPKTIHGLGPLKVGTEFIARYRERLRIQCKNAVTGLTLLPLPCNKYTGRVSCARSHGRHDKSQD